MAVNKVIYDGNTLIDLTADTVTAEALAEGETAHDASGKTITGTMTAVQYGKAQSLSDTQKEQARSNIGAISSDDVYIAKIKTPAEEYAAQYQVMVKGVSIGNIDVPKSEVSAEEFSQLSADMNALHQVPPDYWETELQEGAEAINTALLNAGSNKAAFLFYTDAHWNNGAKRSPSLLKYLYEHTGMAKTFFGGDIVNNEADDYDTMSYLWDWRHMLKGLPNHHSVVGNHDDGNTTNNLFDEKYVYGYLLAAEETPDIVRGESGLYYYIDSPAEKTRYLFLDTAFQSVYYDDAQKEFVKNALLTTEAGWHIVAIAHIWHDTDYTVTPPVPSDLSLGGAYLLGQFDAYNSRSGEYAECAGWVEFCIGGHTHWDFDSTSETGIPVVLVETDSWHVRSGLNKSEGTTNESSVNGIIADYDAKTIHVVRIGRGESRDITVTTTIVKYTNKLPTAIGFDGTILDGQGYRENVRLSTSSNAYSSVTGYDCTGMIEAKQGDVISLKNVTFKADTSEYPRVSSRKANYDAILNSKLKDFATDAPEFKPVYDAENNIVQFTVPTWNSLAEIKYIILCGQDFNSESIITVNEEIT